MWWSMEWNWLSNFQAWLCPWAEGRIRVCSIRSVGSVQTLVVGVFIRTNSWLALDATVLTFSLDLFYTKVRFLQRSILVIKDYKHTFFIGISVLVLMFFWWVLDLCCKRYVTFGVFKALHGNVVCRRPFPFYLFYAILKLQWGGWSKEEDNKIDLWRIFNFWRLFFFRKIFFGGCFVSKLSFFYP